MLWRRVRAGKYNKKSQGEIMTRLQIARPLPKVAAAVALALAAAPALAADADAELQEVTVTGSRIALAPGMTTPSPVTSVTTEDMESLGPGQIIDSLNVLPVFYNNSNANQSLGGVNSGGANVNMHGIGANRTLTLLDGRRVVSSNRFGTVDVNILPSMLIKNVETVTGGASASYGTDAVAGVTNFKLDTRFEGVRLKAQRGETFRNDGANGEYGIAVGHSFLNDRLHFVGSLSRNTLSPINSETSLDKRPYLAHWGLVTNPNASGPTYITRPNVVPTDFGNTMQFGAAANNPLNLLVFDDSGQVARTLPFYGVGTLNGGCNCQALPNPNLSTMGRDNTLQAGYNGNQAFGRLSFDVGETTEVYAQGMWAENHQLVRFQNVALVSTWSTRIYANNAFLPTSVANMIAASGSTSASPASVPVTSPSFISPAQAAVIDGGARWVNATVFLPAQESNIGGDSLLDTGNSLRSYTAGITTKVGEWTIDAYGQHGTNEQIYDANNLPRVDRLQAAMDAVRDANGNIVCRVSLPQFDPKGYWKDCVPVNLFGGVGTLTRQAAGYIMQPYKHAVANITQDLAEVTASGNLGFGLPAGNIAAAVGANWRRDKLSQITPDLADEYPALTDGTLLQNIGEGEVGNRGIIPQYGCPGSVTATPKTGSSVPGLRYAAAGFCGTSNSSQVQFSSQRTISGKSSVKEVFSEFQVPLLADVPFVKRMDSNLAVRWADYSGSGEVWAYKGSLSWELNDQIRLRGTRSRDVRAPNLRDRFDSTLSGAAAVDRSVTPPISYSVVGFSGGNPDVKPEKADTTTAGIVFQPSFLEGFQASVDWYKVEIAGAIAQLTSQVIVDQCNAGDTSLCQYVRRNTDTSRNPKGEITQLDAFFLNLNKETYQGIDVELGYRTPLTLFGGGPESISARVFATHYITVKQVSPDSLTANGTRVPGTVVNNLLTTPDSATAILGYRNGGISTNVVGRYTDTRNVNRLYEESTVRAPTLTGYTTVDDNTVGSMFFMDLNVGWEPGILEGLRLYSTITNLLDHKPAILPTVGGRTGFGPGVA
ncbi:MAG: hypothetical protein EOP21_01130, partial [Hyphomicrobiales bacterium]